MLKILSVLFSLVFVTNLNAAPKYQKIEDYLNSIKTASAGFFQIDQNGGIVEGKFFVKKPGKFKWDYINTNIQIVSDGKTVIYYDKELEQKNYISLKDTVASLLSRENIKLGIDAEVLDYQEKQHSLHLSLAYRKQSQIKEFTLIFQANPLTLGKIYVVDQDDNQLTITLDDFTINQPISDNVFLVEDKRLF